MRMSCNGCRVLRKGCNESCTIKPCLQWIKSPDAQANATVFLAKFYGRAGLLNLINGGPEHLRPSIFRSLLYEACGRIVNPTDGSVGLLWSGKWSLCQAAVEAVLAGDAVTPISCDIRHVSKNGKGSSQVRTKGLKSRPLEETHGAVVIDLGHEGPLLASHESSASNHSGAKEAESKLSMETEETSRDFSDSGSKVALDLTLGLEPREQDSPIGPVKKRRLEPELCDVSLGLGLSGSD